MQLSSITSDLLLIFLDADCVPLIVYRQSVEHSDMLYLTQSHKYLRL